MGESILLGYAQLGLSIALVFQGNLYISTYRNQNSRQIASRTLFV